MATDSPQLPFISALRAFSNRVGRLRLPSLRPRLDLLVDLRLRVLSTRTAVRTIATHLLPLPVPLQAFSDRTAVRAIATHRLPLHRLPQAMHGVPVP